MKKKFLIFLLPLLLLGSFTLSFLLDHETGDITFVPQGFSVTKEWTGRKDPIRSLRVVKRVLAYVDDRYVDPKRIKPGDMFKEAMERVSDVVPEVRVAYPSPQKLLLFVGDQRKEFGTNLRTLFSVHSSLLSSLRFVKSNLISNIPSSDLEVAAIEGLLTTLDPHSVYLSPEIYRETKQETRGKFGGLGILIGMRDGKLTVISPLEGTPAFKAGIKASDVIVKIEGESTINMTLQEAVNRMRGQKGVPITISVSREGWTEPRDFTIIRDIIKIVSIESSHLGEGIAYIQIRAFHGNTVRDLSEHLTKIRKEYGKDLQGLILDLRNNPGGLLDQAIAVSDKFLTGGPIVSTVIAGFRARNQENATRLGTESSYPITVLTNSGSASASEIVAGALQSRGRAVVIGGQTFGKGSVQSIFDLPEDAGLKLTIRQYLTPGDRSIQNIGISPDIRIYPAIINEDIVDIFENPKHIGEHRLEGHFLNPNGEAEAVEKPDDPAFTLAYFEGRTSDEIRDEREENLAKTGKDDKRKQYLSDFSVSIAKKLLLATEGNRRSDVLKAAETVIPNAEERSLKNIQKALSKRDIDWTAPTLTSKKSESCQSPLTAFSASPKKGKKIDAGDEITLTLKVTNKGKCELNRFWAQTESENFLFSNREFLIGHVAPGKSVERRINIKLPQQLPSELVNLKLNYHEAKGVKPEAEEEFLTVYAADSPRFAFKYTVLEAKPKGSANGLFQPGERIRLVAEIKNVGEATALKTMASLKNLSGKYVTLIKGRKELNEIKPGQSANVEFEFDISKDISDSEIKFNYTVFDSETSAFTQKKLEFELYPIDSSVEVERTYRIRRESKVYPQPDQDLLPMGRLDASKTILATAVLGPFARVKLANGGFGWIPTENLEKLETKGEDNFALSGTELAPPKFKIETSKLVQKPFDELFVKVAGQIEDTDSIKDFYVRVNDRKVFYKNYRVNGDPTKKEFETLIPLEKGRNEVIFIAHDEEGLLARERVILHRVDKEATKESPVKAELN